MLRKDPGPSQLVRVIHSSFLGTAEKAALGLKQAICHCVNKAAREGNGHNSKQSQERKADFDDNFSLCIQLCLKPIYPLELPL